MHEGTGYTLHELIFGTPAQIPFNYNTKSAPETYSQHLPNLFNDIKNLQLKAKFNLEKAKKKSKQHHNKCIRPITFLPGDNVFLLNKLKTSKFSSEYVGPYRVVKVMNDKNVIIEIRGTSCVVYSNKLKKAYISKSG